jgi:hypothetical protein
MNIQKDKKNILNKNLAPVVTKGPKRGRCLSCGDACDNLRKRYCSAECRKQMHWVLSLSKGLLSIFSARYASFSFNNSQVILDILPAWSRDISRFMAKRIPGNKPAEDLKNLILQSGSDWHELIHNKNSRSYASLFLLNKNSDKKLPAKAMRPDSRFRPKFSRTQKESIKLLDLAVDDFILGGHKSRIKSAYKKMAKVHHPDVGGDPEKFKKINDAHQQMLLWAESPQFTSKKALMDCWSFDSYSNRWTPPL